MSWKNTAHEIFIGNEDEIAQYIPTTYLGDKCFDDSSSVQLVSSSSKKKKRKRMTQLIYSKLSNWYQVPNL